MCSEIVQKDRFKTTTFRTTVSWLFERHSRVLLHIIMRSCKTLVIGIKHFSRSQVNYFGGIPVCLKRAICCKSRRRFFPRTTSFTARNAGESDFHLFFRCSSSVNGAWWDVCSTPGSSHLCTPQMWCSSDVHRRTHSWKTKWRFWVTQKISPIAFVQSLALWCPCPLTIHKFLLAFPSPWLELQDQYRWLQIDFSHGSRSLFSFLLPRVRSFFFMPRKNKKGRSAKILKYIVWKYGLL